MSKYVNAIAILRGGKINKECCSKTPAMLGALDKLRDENKACSTFIETFMCKDEEVIGTVRLQQELTGGPTTIKVNLSNLPYGPHGFHIHEFGDLTDGCTSAGAHYNPFNNHHGGQDDAERHVGDLGNIHSGVDGVIDATITDYKISLVGPYSVIGRSFVVHADEDDLGKGGHEDSLTTGHSGARIACGIIGLAK
ncbi:MAG: CuZnSOD [Terrestrivirus sp.]|uniref:CuZnSOD n=1 Tax=Terrestrivirus sp. TaxID=2487775 RepID=A0A3G4ZQJ4_9VIRU|nr:MAG: CuZnSOD [Terrestrivirus sp.]